MKLSARTGGIALGLICAVVAGLYFYGAHLSTSSGDRLAASPEMSIPANTFASSTASSAPTATSTPKAKLPTPSGATPIAEPIAPTISSTTIQARALDASGGQLLKSLVNIVCLSSDPSIPSISGSGIIIDPRGIILTAAHVAQLFLLEDYLGPDKVSCIVRSGSPARRAYYAEPIYVSSAWVNNNPNTLTEKSPVGTGENDVALLGITATATSTPLPSTFSYMPLANRAPAEGEDLAIGSYGAQYLDAEELNYSLYPILIFGNVEARYTYHTGSVDVVTVNGNAASQEGSSGGGLATSDGQLIGTITTSSVSGDFSTRLLNAITVGHLRDSYTEDTGAALDTVLANESIPQLIQNFKGTSEALGAQLIGDITSHIGK